MEKVNFVKQNKKQNKKKTDQSEATPMLNSSSLSFVRHF